MDPGNVPLYIGLPRIEPASQTAKLSFQEWLSEQKEKIDVDCGCVSTETLMHWMRVAYEAGNSPVIPDGWISCSERMPEIRQTVIGWNEYAVRQCVYTRNEYAKTQKGREPRFETLTGIWHGVTHWMPLPEPPQEVN
ncbi:DUF551 domain-containing protein [Escherichia coli]|uniref:DUF551 domain-containing protein n=2 Tax=Escherichia coli TaxID=562 RepID=UPI0002419160|nr:hypothetical protein [Escherichia phage TL-2011a]EFI0570769.1 DUF551 domain-containing protein [Escherichia coli]EFO0874105.1 DUF551 domain-containing protein [Escherichia coli O157]EFJ3505897.1 DUF551 domain-containing protein [Escherichia coli]EFO0904421.1 DUF551 domain-containing protein [Escherichia coli O157]